MNTDSTYGRTGLPGFVAGCATSALAALSIVDNLEPSERAVLEAIRFAGDRGLTSDEAEQATGMRHQSCSARIRALFLKEEIELGGTRRNSSGRSARFYVAKPSDKVAADG